MLNPFNPQQDPNDFSYRNIQARVLKSVQSARVNDQIFQVIQGAFEDALKKENIQLIRIEKKRLLAQVMKQVLTEMLAKLEGSANN